MNERDLVVLSERPRNAEIRLGAQHGLTTPADAFFERNHFDLPPPPWHVVLDGEVEHELSLTPDELRALPARTLAVTLECAGNGRSFFEPRVGGEQWRLGAVSTAEWTGVRLRDVLERARPKRHAVEVLFRGADNGTPKEAGTHLAFERSLPLAKALDPDTLVAYAMNGEPLPAEHGAPVRLVVPAWYAVSSVKWLEAITVLDRPFKGFYQKDRYVIGARPLTTMALRAVIATPSDGDAIVRGRHLIRGYAWSGAAPITVVELSVDAGGTWDRAELIGDELRYAWREWQYPWDAREAGAVTIVARAADATGAVQPVKAKHNILGYANNAIQRVRVRVG